MNRLPRLTGREVVDALVKGGFSIAHQRGSHLIMKNPDSRSTVVPIHAAEVIGPGLLSKILRDAELTRDELYNLIHT